MLWKRRRRYARLRQAWKLRGSRDLVRFRLTGMRLDPVTLSDEESISEIMEFYMGDNTIERQNFIRGNLRSEEELEDVNI